MTRYALAIDIGGTFTDAVLLADDGRAFVDKTLTTHSNLLEGFFRGVGLVLTKGFADILYIREEHRYDMYDPQIEFAEPLIPRERTFVVDERVYADGSVAKGVDEAEVEAVVDRCVALGIESVAISLLNAYRNGANEEAITAVFARKAPQIYISRSSEIAPQMREWPRRRCRHIGRSGLRCASSP